MASMGTGGSANSQDFELNLASIIDCFTVLITFMLASASFLSIGVLDAGVAAAGTSSTSATPPPIQINVELSQNQDITLKVSGKTQRNSKFSVLSADNVQKPDLDGLAKALGELKAQYPDVGAITLTAESSVEYERVIRAMDSMRKTMPIVLLGGF